MRHRNALGSGRQHCLIQPFPIGVIGEHESAVDDPPPSDAADGHPARRHGFRSGFEPSDPRRILGRRRGDHQRPGEPLPGGEFTHHLGGREAHSTRPVGSVQSLHRAVNDDRPGGRVDLGEDPLGLAESIGIQHAGPTLIAVLRPPGVDFVDGATGVRPPVDRQAERRLGDEPMASHRLERSAGRIDGELVIAGHHHDFPAVLEPDLARADDMPGRVEREPDAVVLDRFAVVDRRDRGRVAQSCAEDLLAGACDQVMLATPRRVVRMSVSHDRAAPVSTGRYGTRRPDSTGPRSSLGAAMSRSPAGPKIAGRPDPSRRAPHLPSRGGQGRPFWTGGRGGRVGQHPIRRAPRVYVMSLSSPPLKRSTAWRATDRGGPGGAGRGPMAVGDASRLHRLPAIDRMTECVRHHPD